MRILAALVIACLAFPGGGPALAGEGAAAAEPDPPPPPVEARAIEPPAAAPAGEKPAAPAAEPKEDDKLDRSIFVERGEDVMAVITTARRACESGKWRLVIEKYAEARRGLEAERRLGLRPMVAETPRLCRPLQTVIEADLRALPPEGREVYGMLRLGEGRAALARALSGADPDALEAVASEYAGLPVAALALYSLGERFRADGRSGRALACWQRLLVEYPDAEGLDRRLVLVRAALAAGETGRAAEAAGLLAQLKLAAALTRVHLGGDVCLAAEEVERRLRLAKRLSPPDGPFHAGAWPTLGGDASHAGSAAEPVNPEACRWLRSNAEAAAGTGSKRHAVMADGRIFVAGDGGVAACEIGSGRELWRSAEGPGLAAAQLALAACGEGRVYAVHGALGLCALDAASGEPLWRSGEHETGAAAEFLRTVELARAPVYDGGRVYCPATKPGRLRDAYLACFDAASGRLVWWTFVCAGPPFAFAETGLPPAVADGLVALTTNVGAVAVLDAASGAMIWLHLYDRADQPPRRKKSKPPPFSCWTAAAPVIAGGVVFAAPQDCQELLALDLSTGRQVWSMRRGAMTQLVGVSGGRVVCAGGQEAAGFSAADGRGLWRVSLHAEVDGLGLLAADSAVIATRDGLRQLEAESGRARGVCKFRRADAEPGNLAACGGMLVSAGARSVAAFCDWDRLNAEFETRIAAHPEAARARAELGAICLAEGFYDRAAPILQVALNLAGPDEMVDGQLLATAVRRDLRESYRQMVKGSLGGWKRARRALEAEMARRPDAAGARVELGELLLWAEKYREAVPVYRAALDRVEPGEMQDGALLVANVKRRIRECLVKTGRVVESDGESDLRIFIEGRKLRMNSGEDPFEFLRFAGCREALGEFPAAVADYQELIALFPGEIVTAGQGGGARGHAGLHAQARIAAVLARHGRKPYLRFDGEAAELLRRARGERSPDKAGAVVSLYPNSRSVAAALLLLADLAAGEGRRGEEAACLREHLWRCPEAESDTEARVRLALSYRARGLESLCLGMFERLLKTSPGGRFGLDGRKWSVREFVAERMPAVAAAPPAPPARRTETGDVALPPGTAWRAEGLAAAGNSVSLVPPDGGGGAAGAVYVNSDNRIVMALDLADGRTLWQSDEGQYVSCALVTPRTVLAMGSNRLRALARDSGRPVWEFILPFYAYARTEVSRVLLAAGDGVVGVVGDGHAVLLDEGTGLQVWSAKFAGDYCSRVAIAGGLLLASTRNREDGTGLLCAYDLANGTERYRLAYSPGFGNAEFRACGGSIVTYKGGAVDCWDLTTGRARWRSSGGGGNSATPLALDDSRAIILAQVPGGEGARLRIGAWDVSAGRQLWDTGPLDRQFPGPWLEPADSTGRVVFSAPDSRGTRQEMMVLDGASGRPLPPVGLNASGQPVATAGQILVMTAQEGPDGKSACQLHVIEAESGRLLGSREYPAGSRLATVGGAVAIIDSNGGLEMLVRR